jgi:hypothetical protein
VEISGLDACSPGSVPVVGSGSEVVASVNIWQN